MTSTNNMYISWRQ